MNESGNTPQKFTFVAKTAHEKNTLAFAIAHIDSATAITDFLDSFLEADLDRLEKACDLLKMGIAARREELLEHD